MNKDRTYSPYVTKCICGNPLYMHLNQDPGHSFTLLTVQEIKIDEKVKP